MRHAPDQPLFDRAEAARTEENQVHLVLFGQRDDAIRRRADDQVFRDRTDPQRKQRDDSV